MKKNDHSNLSNFAEEAMRKTNHFNSFLGIQPERISERIKTYESFGNHQPGSVGDDLTTAWLEHQLSEFGINAKTESFEFPLFEYNQAQLILNENIIDGIPMFDGGFTTNKKVIGPIIEDETKDLSNKIFVAKTLMTGNQKWMAADAKEYFEYFSAKGALAIVIPSEDPLGEIVVRNAESILEPFQIPVLQIKASELKKIDLKSNRVNQAEIIINGARRTSRAKNLFVDIPVDGSSRNSVLGIMTPKSGWFSCAAERGAGLAIWLAIAEAMVLWLERDSPLHLLSTSGHELGHQGLLHHLRNVPDHSDQAMFHPADRWLHLGASIGAGKKPNGISQKVESTKARCSENKYKPLIENAMNFAGITNQDYELLDPLLPIEGEARDIHSRSGKFISILGRHDFFHSPSDTFKNCVDTHKISKWAVACIYISFGLSGESFY